jgi:hypothetical protein
LVKCAFLNPALSLCPVQHPVASAFRLDRPQTGSLVGDGVPAEASALTRAHFWRWFIAILLVFVVADYDVDRLAVRLWWAGGPRSFGAIFLFSVYGGMMLPALVYAATFFLNLFVVLSYDRVAGEHKAWRVLAGVIGLAAVSVVSGVLAIVLGDLAYFAGAYFETWIAFTLSLPIVAAVAGAFFAAAVGLFHRFSAAETGRSPGLMKAHILGGVIAGILLGLPLILPAFATVARHFQSEIIGGVLYVALIPHLILTWRAIRPALEERAGSFPGIKRFSMRLGVVLVLLVIVAAALFLAPHGHV